MAQNRLQNAKRIVIKLSSSLLVNATELNRLWLEDFIEDILLCLQAGQQVMLVSSGAVALGRRALGLPAGQLRLEQQQAAAACGQTRLIHAYHEILSRHNRSVAQLLLTPHDTEARQPYLNARATLRSLLDMGVVPIINENDAVTMPALRFTDNDQLAARVASMMEADCLLLLSDIDGLYTADPRHDPKAEFLPEVRAITNEIVAMAGGSSSGTGRGGMITKISAARVAMKAGCSVVIARGSQSRPLSALKNDAKATWFIPEHSPMAAWKIWISGTLNPRGTVTIDAGAEQALRQGKSLLAAGITALAGQFDGGDPVRVLNARGEEIARGLIAYNQRDTFLLQGRRSEDFSALLGYEGRAEIIHRDDLVLV
jgi:glutamate 5-kinase